MDTPETTQLAKDTATTLAVATQFKITDNAGYEQAGGMLKGIKGLREKIGATFDPHIKRAFEAHRSLVAEKKTHETPLLEAESILKRSMLGFQQEQERARREEQARLEELARKERDKLEVRAAKAEQSGKIEKAEELRTQADTIPAPVVIRETPKVAGISTRKTYGAKVTDVKALAAAVAAGTVPANTIDPNMAVLNALARALKEGFSYPGCELVVGETLASRSA